MATSKSYLEKHTTKSNKKNPNKEDAGSEQTSAVEVETAATKLKYKEQSLPDDFKSLEPLKKYVHKMLRHMHFKKTMI